MAAKRRKKQTRKQKDSSKAAKPARPEDRSDETLEAPELNEIPEDSSATLQPVEPRGDSDGETSDTLSPPDIPEPKPVPMESGSDAQSSVEQTEIEKTEILSSESDRDQELEQVGGATAALPEEDESGTAETTEFKSEEGSEGSGSSKRSSGGWLKGLGSSQNVESSIIQSRPLASDSVFERVAKRMLVTDTAAQISESFDTKADPADRKRMQEFLNDICKGAEQGAADYNLTGIAGRGGMGVVLTANQTTIDRKVAIKLLQPGKEGTVSSKSEKQKFFYEAQITGQLDHPNIVPVYELGETNGVFFYSMKYIEGREWKQVMDQQTLDEKLDTWMKVADAVAFAHSKGIIHRDLKPANVMIGPFGEVLVTDWGLAVDLKRKDQTPSRGGSLPWMAPEMANHQREKIRECSDIYLLGAMLFELLTGYAPHRFRTFKMCEDSARKNTFRAYDILEPEMEPLMEIAKKAMKTEPSERYLTVGAIQAAIREYERHLESIREADESSKMFYEAKSEHDLQLFSKSILGFERAIKRWDGNAAAKEGLAKAKLGYGQAAFDRGNFDLCISTLNDDIPEQAELRAKAVKAKELAEQRDRRIKRLWLTVATVLVLGIGATSIAAVWAKWNESKARKAEEQVAIKNVQLADTNEELADTNEALANTNKELEETNDELAISLVNEQQARDLAEWNSDDSFFAVKLAQGQEKRALEQKERAEREQKRAEQEKVRAEIATVEEKVGRTKVELGSLVSTLGLAHRSVDQVDVGSALTYIRDLLDAANFEVLNEFNARPKLDNWGFQRTELLTNNDLLSEEPLGDEVSHVAFAQQRNRGVVAVRKDGEYGLQRIRLEGNHVEPEGTMLSLEAAVDGLIISPAGDEAIYSLALDGKSNTVYRWDLESQDGQVVAGAEKRSLQGFAISEDAVVSGINGGLLVWNRKAGGWWQERQPQRITNLTGRLQSLQLVDGNYALVLSLRNRVPTVYWARLQSGAGEPQAVQFETDEESVFDPAQLRAVAYVRDRMILGTADGRLYSTSLSPGDSRIDGAILEIGPRQHFSAIRSIKVDPADGTLVTTASEPAAQVWKPATTPSGWNHYTYLAGTPTNVGAISFIQDSALILGIGEDGHPIVWDVKRQKQRREFVPLDENGAPFEYNSPVIKVVISEDNQRAVAVQRNGAVHVWNPITGDTIGADGSSISYFGHAPGSRFVDMAIDASSATLLTTAALPSENPLQGKLQYEFCKWDLRSGTRVDRWTKTRDSDPLISLVDQGRLALYSSYSTTIIEETRRQSPEVFRYVSERNNDVPSMYALENPNQPSLLMTVKDNGPVRIVDRNGWEVVALIDKNARPEDRILQAAWSPSGDRFFVVWRTGEITEFTWRNGELKQDRSLAIGRELGAVGHNQLDMRIREKDADVWVHLAIEDPRQPTLVRARFPQSNGRPDLQVLQPRDRDWNGNSSIVLTDEDVPTLELEPRSRLPISDRKVVASKRVGETSFLATDEGNVYRVQAAGQIDLLGSTSVVAAAGDRTATRIVMLLDGGFLKRMDWENDRWIETPLENTSSSAKTISMSPDGKLILLRFEDQQAPRLQLVKADTGEPVEAEMIERGVSGAWNARGDLAILDADGALHLQMSGESEWRRVGEINGATKPNQVLGLHFFTEAWSEREPVEWLMIHAAAGGGSNTIEYVPLNEPVDVRSIAFEQDPQAEDVSEEEGEADALPEGRILTLENAGVVACSPTEGILVTGTKDRVAVRFASPSLGELGSELFSLKGHGGAGIETLMFAPDGKTLVSTDNLNRVFEWISSDPDGVRVPLDDVASSDSVTTAAP